MKVYFPHNISSENVFCSTIRFSFQYWDCKNTLQMKESVNRAHLRLTQKMCSSWQYFLSTIAITIITPHLRLTQKMCFSSPYFLSTGSRHFSKPSTEVWPAPKRGKPGSWKRFVQLFVLFLCCFFFIFFVTFSFFSGQAARKHQLRSSPFCG